VHKGFDSLGTLLAHHAEVLGATLQEQAENRAGRYKLAYLDCDRALNDAR
jgi:thioredoxin-like negative regulator of GroEL